MVRLCFVCLGNICRSPLAEGVFLHLAAAAGRAQQYSVESAGLGGWHVGEPPDPRAQRVAQAHGITLSGRARRFRRDDFARFDLIVALDQPVLAGLADLAPQPAARAKLRCLRDFDAAAAGQRDVPDPYDGDERQFELAYQLIEPACRGLLAQTLGPGG